MASQATSSQGTKFRRWNGSEWEYISEINSITGPGMTRDTMDVTSLDSVDGYREFKTGFRNAGTLSLSSNFTRHNYDLMKADFESDELQNYEIVLPDNENTTFEFEGIVTEIPLSIPTGDKITMDITIQISGPVTVNSGENSSLNG